MTPVEVPCLPHGQDRPFADAPCRGDPAVARGACDPEGPGQPPALRHHLGQRIGRVDRQRAEGGACDRSRPCDGGGAVDVGRVRGQAARVLRGRTGRGHGGTDGPVVPRLRQLGRVRHRVLRAVRSHAACVAVRRPLGAAPARVRASRGVRADGQSRRPRQGVGRRLFAERLPLVEEAASDERDLVRKGVSWALRTTGRRNEALHGAALAVAKRLADASDAGSRWVGKDAVRELTGPIVARQLQRRRAAKKR